MAIAPDSPDWRWHAVTTLLSYTHSKAIAVSQQMDPLTQKVYKFRRQFKDRLIGTLPNYVNAHEIWMQRPFQRSALEGLILGGADDFLIQEEMEIDSDDIAAYTSMFFDVRGRRRMDVSNMVFKGSPHVGYHEHDRVGVMHRLGWFGGARVIQSILARGLSEDAAQSYCAEVCKDMIRRQLPEIALGAGRQRELAPEYLRIAMDWDAKKGAVDPSGVMEGVTKFMKGCGLSVADTSEPANLKLPAKEPRFIAATEVPDAINV